MSSFSLPNHTRGGRGRGSRGPGGGNAASTPSAETLRAGLGIAKILYFKRELKNVIREGVHTWNYRSGLLRTLIDPDDDPIQSLSKLYQSPVTSSEEKSKFQLCIQQYNTFASMLDQNYQALLRTTFPTHEEFVTGWRILAELREIFARDGRARGHSIIKTMSFIRNIDGTARCVMIISSDLSAILDSSELERLQIKNSLEGYAMNAERALTISNTGRVPAGGKYFLYIIHIYSANIWKGPVIFATWLGRRLALELNSVIA